MPPNTVRQLGKGMLLVLSANVVKMVLNTLLGFLQPKYLSVDTYASLKTFTLYLTMSGIFHLGYADGSFLKYGGKNRAEIDPSDLAANLSTLRLFQLAVGLSVLAVAFAVGDNVLKWFSLILLPFNMVMQFKLIYQATGEFKLYGRIVNGGSAILFLCDILLIFAFGTDFYAWYLLAQVFVYAMLWLLLEIDMARMPGYKLRVGLFRFREFADNLVNGFLLMLGNFSNIFLTSIDRWFVKFLLPTFDFAAYCFAVSMEAFMTVAVSPFTVTLYNYFCRESRPEKIKRLQNCVLLFASALVSLAFPVKFVLERWLVRYLPSVRTLFFLFAAQMLFVVVKSIYVNLYKARKWQKRYFAKLVVVLASGAVFNAACFSVWRAKEAMALGTLLSALLWFILSQADFREIRFSLKPLCFLFLQMGVFFATGTFLPALAGFAVYVVFTMADAAFFMGKDCAACAHFALSFIRNRSRGKGNVPCP